MNKTAYFCEEGHVRSTDGQCLLCGNGATTQAERNEYKENRRFKKARQLKDRIAERCASSRLSLEICIRFLEANKCDRELMQRLFKK